MTAVMRHGCVRSGQPVILLTNQRLGGEQQASPPDAAALAVCSTTSSLSRTPHEVENDGTRSQSKLKAWLRKRGKK